MIFSNIFIYILSSLAGIGLVVGGLGYAISLFNRGYKKNNNEIVSSSTEIITFYKTENESLKLIMAEKDKSNDEKFRQLSAEIGELRGQLNSEKANNERLEKIFQNRDPDTQKFQELLVKACIDQGDINKEVVAILKAIHDLAIQEHERDFTITSTVTKE